MASANQIDEVFSSRDSGVTLLRKQTVPRPLPKQDAWHYYQIKKTGSAWDSVVDDCTLALKVNPEMVDNIGTWKGQNVMELTEDDVKLEFRLFAVPRNQ